MKSIVLLLLTGACLCAQQQGSLEGTAIHALTREPLSNVHVRLIAANFAGVNGAYGAMSDRAGHFSIATIRPGTYILLPERSGFLHVQAKTGTAIPTLAIKPGEHLTGYQLEMTPRAILAGRVIDEAGDPVQGVRVQAVPVSPETAPTIIMAAPNPATDDRGEFRIIGSAGKYYLQATMNSQSGGNERPEVRSDGTSEAIYGTTFYPSLLRKDRAMVVEALAGKDVSGLEIRLARQQGGLSISGIVTGIPEGATGRPFLVLLWGEKAPMISNSRSTSAGPDGKFKFESLQPGFYRISAQYNDGKTTLASRMVEWTIDNTEVANVQLALVAGLAVAGKVRIEGDAPGTHGTKRTVKLEPAVGYNFGNLSRSGGEVDADGMFRITGAGPARYKVRVEPLPENAYIKTLEIDGASTAGDIMDLSTAVKSVNANIVIGRNGVAISGRVLDANGERMQTNVVMIFLIKDFSEITSGVNGNGTTQATPDGKYTLKAVAPGKYKLFAIDAFQMRGGPAMLDAFKGMFDRMEEVDFKEGGPITKDLKVLLMEDPNAKPKK